MVAHMADRPNDTRTKWHGSSHRNTVLVLYGILVHRFIYEYVHLPGLIKKDYTQESEHLGSTCCRVKTRLKLANSRVGSSFGLPLTSYLSRCSRTPLLPTNLVFAFLIPKVYKSSISNYLSFAFYTYLYFAMYFLWQN